MWPPWFQELTNLAAVQSAWTFSSRFPGIASSGADFAASRFEQAFIPVPQFLFF